MSETSKYIVRPTIVGLKRYSGDVACSLYGGGQYLALRTRTWARLYQSHGQFRRVVKERLSSPCHRDN